LGLALSCTASSITMAVDPRVCRRPTQRRHGRGVAAGSLGLVIASPLAQTLISQAAGRWRWSGSSASRR